MADNRLFPFSMYSTNGTLTSADQVSVDTTNIDGNLGDLTINNLQDLLEHIDDDKATNDEYIGYTLEDTELTVKSSLTDHGQFLIQTYTDNIVVAMPEQVSSQIKYIIAYAGSGLGDENAELVYMKVTNIAQSAIGSDPLDPDYYQVTFTGELWKGAAEKGDVLNPIAFGSVDEKVKLKFLGKREVSAVDREFTQTEKDKLKDISSHYFLSEYVTIRSSDGHPLRFIKSIDDIVGHWTSTFNTDIPATADAGNSRLIFSRNNAPIQSTAFDTITINSGSVSTGTFSISQAEANALRAGNGHIQLFLRLIDTDGNTLLYRDAGDILFEHELDDADNTFFVRASGDDTYSGTNEQYPVATFSQALTDAGALAGTEHKMIVADEIHDYDEDLTTIANLRVYAPGATLNDVDSSNHSSTIKIRKCDKIIVGANSDIDIQTIGYEATDGIRFPSGITHSRTRIKVHDILSPSTIDFTGATGSIHIEVEEYGGSYNTMLGTIAAGLNVSGYIGSYSFDDKVDTVSASKTYSTSTDFEKLNNSIVNLDNANSVLNLNAAQFPLQFYFRNSTTNSIVEIDGIGSGSVTTYGEIQPGDYGVCITTDGTNYTVYKLNTPNKIYDIKSFLIDSISNNKEYPLVIKSIKDMAITEFSIWHPGNTGQMTVQLKKNGTNVGTAMSTTTNTILSTGVSISLAAGDNLTADVSGVVSISGPVSMEFKYSSDL